ncbi:MAG: hypothetical protein C0483_26445 [Pirellula sp.]|nr:hypothetical protein [Pirellula sp.]
MPTLANALCIFTVVLLPLYWVLGAIVSIVTLEETDAGLAEFLYGFLVRGPISLGITIMLVVAGLRLRNLRASGVRLIKIGFIVDFALLAVSVFVAMPVVAFVAANDPNPSAQATGFASLLMLLQVLTGVGALAFEIVAFIWLLNNATTLPLDTSR